MAPPTTEARVVGQRHDDRDQHPQHRADDEAAADFGPGHLDPAGQAEADGQHHRSDHVDEPAEREADAQARGRGIEDGAGADPIGSGRLLPVRSRPEPARRARARESRSAAARDRTSSGTAAPGPVGERGSADPRARRSGRPGRAWRGADRTSAWSGRLRRRRPLPGAAAGRPDGAPQCTAPQAESEVIVLAATSKGCCGSRCSAGRRDQRGQRRHRHRRLVERGTVLGGQRRHLGHRRGDRQRRGGRFGELGRTLDRSVLRTVLPGCHAVIVDAFARPAARSSRPRTGQRIRVGGPGRSGYA